MLKNPYAGSVSKNTAYIDSFAGINERLIKSANEFESAVNLSDREYPALSVRPAWEQYRSKEKYSALMSIAVVNSKAALLFANGDFFYGDEKLSLSVPNNKMVRCANRLFLYPSNIVIDLPNEKEASPALSRNEPSFELKVGASSAEGVIQGIAFVSPAIASSLESTYIQSNDPASSEGSSVKAGEIWSSPNGAFMYSPADDGSLSWKYTEADGCALYFLTSPEDGGYMTEEELGEKFKTGDALYLKGGDIFADGAWAVVEDIASDKNKTPCLILNKPVYAALQESGVLSVTRKIRTDIDFALEFENRMWGCFSGYGEDGLLYNEIFASAAGDASNWFRFDGTLAQSWAASITSDGKFTGIGTVNGHVAFFKEKCVHLVYGTNPTSFSVSTVMCPGVKEGCGDSVVSVNGVTYYMSQFGVMAMADGYPECVSSALDLDGAKNASAGTDGKHYYLSLFKDAEHFIYVLNTETGIWHSIESGVETGDDDLVTPRVIFDSGVMCVSSPSAEVYAAKKQREEVLLSEQSTALERMVARIWLYFSRLYYLIAGYDTSVSVFSASPSFPEVGECPVDFSTNVSEKDVAWECVTGRYGFSYSNFKTPSSVGVRLLLEEDAYADIEIEYDSSGDFEHIEHIEAAAAPTVRFLSIRPQECDHFAIKLSGCGQAYILSLQYKYSSSGSCTYD